jgi:hypothetical protein
MGPSANVLEVFLILDQPLQRLSHWVTALARLSAPDVAPYNQVELFYEVSSERAYVRLLYDQRQVGKDKLQFLIDCAELAEIRMLEPSTWPLAERTRFVNDRIARCEVSVTDRRTIAATLAELMKRARVQRTMKPLVAMQAKSNHIDSPAPPTEDAIPTASDDAPTGRRPRSEPESESIAIVVDEIDDNVSRPVMEMPLQPMTHNPPPTPLPISSTTPLQRSKAPSISGVSRQPSRSPLLSSPSQSKADVRVADGSQSHRALAADVDVTTIDADDHRKGGTVDPTQWFASQIDPKPATIISARFLRGGRWLPARIGSLSLRNGLLLCGVTPRQDDVVHIALAFADNAALVRGRVTRLTTSPQEKGAAGFAVAFDLDGGSQQQLVALLTAARAAKVIIKPPPARVGRRFPVEWPVCFGTTRGPVRAEALDVSGAGMFVAPIRALELGTNLSFSAVLDDGKPAVVGRARVVRHVNDSDARRLSFSAGYGVALEGMTTHDGERWATFIGRIQKRSDCRILVGASPSRLAEISAGLVAAGYSVTGGSDAGSFVQLAQAEPRPVDAAVIDPEWVGAGHAGLWLESLLHARNVPCISTHGDARRARVVVDRLLLG